MHNLLHTVRWHIIVLSIIHGELLFNSCWSVVLFRWTLPFGFIGTDKIQFMLNCAALLSVWSLVVTSFQNYSLSSLSTRNSPTYPVTRNTRMLLVNYFVFKLKRILKKKISIVVYTWKRLVNCDNAFTQIEMILKTAWETKAKHLFH